MAETASELKERVDLARGRLEQDLNSLQYHVRASLDWKTQYRRFPWAFLGAAFTSALMLGLAYSRMLPRAPIVLVDPDSRALRGLRRNR
ncbi:MAG TPA: hypothetical protein VKV17_22795 [Bryobacteraceae bacterium]|nr:hypothetical protein [Bryobacteraceae bacterium]